LTPDHVRVYSANNLSEFTFSGLNYSDLNFTISPYLEQWRDRPIETAATPQKWEGANSGSKSWKIRGESIKYASLLFSSQGAFLYLYAIFRRFPLAGKEEALISIIFGG
jgi:hypothetical protein